MDEPLCVIRNASPRSLTRMIYDVLVFPDRLLSVRAPGGRALMRESDRRDAERRPGPRLVRWKTQSLSAPGELLGEIADDRVRELLRASERELLARAPDNRRVDIAAIAEARLARRLGTCWLRLVLTDGGKLRWGFQNGAIGADYDRVVAVLADLLGPRLVT